jgi:hypothetical protein
MDEPPPEDDFDPYARPVGPLSDRRPAAPPDARPAEAPAGDAPSAAPQSRYAALRASMPAATRPSRPRVEARVVADDEPSVDDADVEDSGLVGPSVVAQLLGGRVIEERNE